MPPRRTVSTGSSISNVISRDEAGRTPDYLEGVTAFLEKRAPRFTGRPDGRAIDRWKTRARGSPRPAPKRCGRTIRRARALGMAIERVAPGEAVLSMTVRRDMTNGHGICHGGFIFTLADSAFAFACNTYNQRTVAQHCAVTFMRAGPPARADGPCARASIAQGRSGIYDVTVRDGKGGSRCRIPRSFAHDLRQALPRSNSPIKAIEREVPLFKCRSQAVRPQACRRPNSSRSNSHRGTSSRPGSSSGCMVAAPRL